MAAAAAVAAFVDEVTFCLSGASVRFFDVVDEATAAAAFAFDLSTDDVVVVVVMTTVLLLTLADDVCLTAALVTSASANLDFFFDFVVVRSTMGTSGAAGSSIIVLQ